MPSVILKVKGMVMITTKAGKASVKLSQFIRTMLFIIRKPTKIRAGAITGYKCVSPTMYPPPIISARGLKNNAPTNNSPVTTLAKPVLPPWAIPDELSI